MQKLIELEDAVYEIDETYLSTSTAFDNDGFTYPINNDFDSIKEALNKYDKIFLTFGDFGYDDYEEPFFSFDDEEFLDCPEFDDEYYDKYKFTIAGYGFFINKDLNVEYGYFTMESSSSGHGAGHTTFHDFKDAKEGDLIKEKIFSKLDEFYLCTDD